MFNTCTVTENSGRVFADHYVQRRGFTETDRIFASEKQGPWERQRTSCHQTLTGIGA